jgi:hypothetical protein
MNKDELIVKQALEIEQLKETIQDYKNAISDARNCLWRPEQWSTKCPDFPKVSMNGILKARNALEGF